MKKIIQVCSFLTLAILFSAVAAKAQTVSTFNANIPFEFKVGAKSYQAGDYQLSISTTVTGGAVVTIADTEGRRFQSLLVSRTEEKTTGKPDLVFTNANNGRLLSRIVTRGVSFALIGSDHETSAVTENRDRRGNKTRVSL